MRLIVLLLDPLRQVHLVQLVLVILAFVRGGVFDGLLMHRSSAPIGVACPMTINII